MQTLLSAPYTHHADLNLNQPSMLLPPCNRNINSPSSSPVVISKCYNCASRIKRSQKETAKPKALEIQVWLATLRALHRLITVG